MGYEPNYIKYKSTITVERLDRLASFVFGGDSTSSFGTMIAALKLAVAVAYVLARKILIEHELAIAKQEYEQRARTDIRDNLDRDNLDVKTQPANRHRGLE